MNIILFVHVNYEVKVVIFIIQRNPSCFHRMKQKFSSTSYLYMYFHLQPEVVMDVRIKKPSLYRLIYRYINVNDGVIRGEVTLKPQSLTSDTAQMSEVFFQPTTTPAFVTVGSSGSQTDFVLNPGRWMISIKTPDIMLLVGIFVYIYKEEY